MNEEKFRSYLVDLSTTTKEYAREAIADYVSARGQTKKITKLVR